jgi:MFS family permease
MTKQIIITRAVWTLSFVSLFTDVASEMLYPIMPLYLKSIGFSVLLIGVLEGVAEATAGLSKGYFGALSDASGRRVPFVRLGYTLSAVSKPMMAVLARPLWILLARATDRLGKGIRTAARDALLSDEATPETKARVFGLHRSMDTLGAVIGPAIALAYLWFNPAEYRTLFFIAFIPGIIAVALTFLLNDKPFGERREITRPTFFAFLRYWKIGTVPYRRLVIGLLLFALFNSSDVFLLLKVKETGLSDAGVIGVYIFYNLIYALLSYPAGAVADRLGVKWTFVAGLAVFALVYGGMAFASGLTVFLGLFFLYGVYAACTESIAKAWITNIAVKSETATAIGLYSAAQSICAFAASSLAGLLWFAFGVQTTFLVTAAATVVVIVYCALAVESPRPRLPSGSAPTAE